MSYFWAACDMYLPISKNFKENTKTGLLQPLVQLLANFGQMLKMATCVGWLISRRDWTVISVRGRVSHWVSALDYPLALCDIIIWKGPSFFSFIPLLKLVMREEDAVRDWKKIGKSAGLFLRLCHHAGDELECRGACSNWAEECKGSLKKKFILEAKLEMTWSAGREGKFLSNVRRGQCPQLCPV